MFFFGLPVLQSPNSQVAPTCSHGTKLQAEGGRTEPVKAGCSQCYSAGTWGVGSQSSRVHRVLAQQTSSCPEPPQLLLKRSLLQAQSSEQTGKQVPWQGTSNTEPAWSSEQVISTETHLHLLRTPTPGPKSQGIPQPKRDLWTRAKALPDNPSTQPPANSRAHLEYGDMGLAIRAHLAAIHFNMLQPLDVWLGITIHLAVELYVTA